MEVDPTYTSAYSSALIKSPPKSVIDKYSSVRTPPHADKSKVVVIEHPPVEQTPDCDRLINGVGRAEGAMVGSLVGGTGIVVGKPVGP